MIELRCESELHAKLNPERRVIQIKCKSCTRKAGREIFHHYLIEDIIDRHQRGELNGVVRPNDPYFVHWIVKSVA